MFNFTEIIDRVGKDAIAYDAQAAIRGGSLGPTDVEVAEGFDIIPMWVADMSFATAPSVTRALHERVDHPCFGYFAPSSAYYDAIIRWHERRNGVTGMRPEHIAYENGVLGGVASALAVLCSRGDSVLVHAPTYVGFSKTLRNAGYDLVPSELIRDDQGVWRMDFDDMERKIVDHKIHAAIFCSPHNPTGRVWERWEIERAMDLFRAHDVYVIADEIWSDILLDGHAHTPTQSVSEDARNRTIALYAPSKTFNLAGLIGSYRVVYNDWLRDRLDKEDSLSHYNSQNVLSMHALMGAYCDEGMAWVDELNEVLSENAHIAYDFFTGIPGVSCSRPEGTYMLFLDCGGWCRDYGVSIDELQRSGVRVGVLWQDGRAFGGEATIRMNLALPTKRLRQALNRLEEHVFVSKR